MLLYDDSSPASVLFDLLNQKVELGFLLGLAHTHQGLQGSDGFGDFTSEDLY
jgi:hypothetical protein